MAESAAAPAPKIETSTGLVLWTTTTPDTPVFQRFFDGYDKAFVLPNEKEDEAGFARCFEMNVGADYARLSKLYGPYSEVSLIAEENGADVGGANFIAIPTDDRTVTANLNYLYLHEAARGKGNFSRMFNAVREAVAGLFPGKRDRVLIFIEQNDPFRMSSEDYERDTKFTGLDQFDRLRIWAKRGARVVDFPYAQPPLSADQDLDDTLIYSVLGADNDLDACTLEAHLRRFFAVSVLKGADLGAIPGARKQVDDLRAACRAKAKIALLDPGRVLGELKRREDIERLWKSDAPRDFRTAIRRYG